MLHTVLGSMLIHHDDRTVVMETLQFNLMCSMIRCPCKHVLILLDYWLQIMLGLHNIGTHISLLHGEPNQFIWLDIKWATFRVEIDDRVHTKIKGYMKCLFRINLLHRRHMFKVHYLCGRRLE